MESIDGDVFQSLPAGPTWILLASMPFDSRTTPTNTANHNVEVFMQTVLWTKWASGSALILIELYAGCLRLTNHHTGVGQYKHRIFITGIKGDGGRLGV